MAAPLEMSEKNESDVQADKLQLERKSLKTKALIFTAAGMSVFAGFGYSLYKANKKDPRYFEKMLNGAKGRDVLLGQSGVGVASRALVCGTILSVTSFAATVWLTYKLTGVNNVYEFHNKLRTYFPYKPRTGRSEFANLHELAEYLESEDRKAEIAAKKKMELESKQKLKEPN